MSLINLTTSIYLTTAELIMSRSLVTNNPVKDLWVCYEMLQQAQLVGWVHLRYRTGHD